jgi:hypothetical protein
MQGAIIDLHMFVVAGGRERSISQYADLLQHADLSMTATTPLPPGQSSSELPLRWWGVKPTLSRISQLDEPPDPHSTQEETLKAPVLRYVNSQGYTDPTRSASFPTEVNNVGS